MRTVFEKIPMDGFRTTKVESIAICNSGLRLFVGTSDGALIAYDCQTSVSSYSKFQCGIFSTIKSQVKEKKPVLNLTAVESWGVVIGIVEGVITAFDVNSFAVRSILPDTKGSHVFSTHEYNGIMAVANKRKITIYSWIQPSSLSSIAGGFIFRREVSTLIDLPKNIVCVSNSIIVGFKRSYEAFDMNTLTQTKILEVDKDQKMLCLEIPMSDLRPSSIVLAHGNQGLIYELFKIIPNPAVALSNMRLEWSSQPVSVHYFSPYFVSLLQDAIEIHDLVTLSPLQKIPLSVPTSTLSTFGSSSTAPYCYTSCEVDPSKGLEHAYVSTGDQAFVLRMTPLSAQITLLLDSLRFEEAINLCILSSNNPQLRDIDVTGVHEKYASSLYQRGDFDNAIANFIKADSSPQKVLPLFPDLVPQAFHGYLGISQPNTTGNRVSGKILPQAVTGNRMTGVTLSRAASALVQYCESFRSKRKSQIEMAEKYRTAALSASSAFENIESLVGTDWEEFLRLVEVVDTVLLSSLLNCSPLRKNAVVEFLSSQYPTNCCHMESAANMLVAQGNAFTEALLWLYRSHHEYRRVLVALTEDRCVGGGAWTREQFYNWTADFLRWLWFSDDSKLPALVLNALKPVLDYDPELGLSVLTQRPKLSFTTAASLSMLSTSPSKGNSSSTGMGGKGIEIQEIISYLESYKFKSSLNTSTTNMTISTALKDRKNTTNNAAYINVDTNELKIPLINGRALTVAYLEWRVNNGSVPPGTHNEYARMLINSIPIDESIDHHYLSLDIKASDPEVLVAYKIYRRKLQHFLQNSSEYHPDDTLKLLPSAFLHEYALILSKLGRHEEVLKIYVKDIQDMTLAETYCERVYQRSGDEKSSKRLQSTVSRNPQTYVPDVDNIYLTLMKVLLSGPKTEKSVPSTAFVVELAEKYHDRLDSISFLKMLPQDVPIASLSRYLSKVLEYASFKKRNLQVIHQLLRVQEVRIRTNQTSS